MHKNRVVKGFDLMSYEAIRNKLSVTERVGCDVVVVGGGTSGAIAGIAAARTGARTLIVEQYGYLGGVLSLGMPLLGVVDTEGYWALGGIGRELVERLRRRGGATDASLDPHHGSLLAFEPEMAKIELLRMGKEAGVEFLFHSMFVDTVVEDGAVGGVVVANKAGLQVVPTRAVADCSGDADVVARSGGSYVVGRTLDGRAQPVTRIFRIGPIDFQRVFGYLEENERNVVRGPDARNPVTVEWLRKTPGAIVGGFAQLVRTAREAGEYHIPRPGLGFLTLPGRDTAFMNMTRVQNVDALDPDGLTTAEVESHYQMEEAVAFLRKYVPGCERVEIVSSPHQLGVRETRHIVGGYTVTEEDVLAGRDFEDQVGRCAYPLDVHDVSEVQRDERRRHGDGVFIPLRRSVGIPVRSLVPDGCQNVIVGGRCISATHEAAGSLRGQAACMVSGHAAGTAAALIATKEWTSGNMDVGLLQRLLVGQGAILERSEQLA